MPLTRKEILHDLVRIFRENFEIDNPGLEDDLREEYEFDSIDAIELLVEIEKMLGFPLTQEEKKEAINIRTFNQICDYIEAMASART
jgi:acyl carrier protein